MEKYRIQSKDIPTKTKWITSSDYKIGDTVTMKWHKEWVVIEVKPLKGN